MKKDIQKLYKEFESLETDVQKWKWIIDNQNKGITIYCDNDDTFACFDEEDEENEYNRIILEFDHYIGWSYGVFNLLDAVGIKSECV